MQDFPSLDSYSASLDGVYQAAVNENIIISENIIL